jgi:hypothetical protein
MHWTRQCELCEPNMRLTRHHLIPKSTWPRMEPNSSTTGKLGVNKILHWRPRMDAIAYFARVTGWRKVFVENATNSRAGFQNNPDNVQAPHLSNVNPCPQCAIHKFRQYDSGATVQLTTRYCCRTNKCTSFVSGRANNGRKTQVDYAVPLVFSRDGIGNMF